LTKTSFWEYALGNNYLSKIFGRQITPRLLFDFLCNSSENVDGRALFAPYGLRKVEAALLRDGYTSEDVVVAHPDHIERFIGPQTEVVGTYEMDPLGMGPVTMTFTYGRKSMSYAELCNRDLHMKINAAKKKNASNAKVIAGASGTWQYNFDPKKIEEYGLYGVVEGELGGIGPELDGSARRFFDAISSGELDVSNPFKKSAFKLEIKEFNLPTQKCVGRFIHFSDEPTIDEIPDIVNPSIHALVEVMRGCGRGCKFCDVTLRRIRYYPIDKVQREIEVNMKLGGLKNAWIHSDDIFVYGLNPRASKNMYPNREALEELFTGIMATGVEHTNPTHGTLAGAISDERMLPNLSKIIRAGPNNHIGIQCGLETGSTRLIQKYADRKLAPFRANEWHWVVKQAIKSFNEHYWIPAFTLILGLNNDETTEDSWETINLIHEVEMEQPESKFVTSPLTFVPIGLLHSAGFYDLSSSMGPAQFGLLYKTWQHNLKYGIKKFMWQVSRDNMMRSLFFVMLAAALGGIPLAAMERFARRKGIEHERVIEKIKANYA
jgi:radical SAM superfamily enzyme YgiQ (UPF0313 family)